MHATRQHIQLVTVPDACVASYYKRWYPDVLSEIILNCTHCNPSTNQCAGGGFFDGSGCVLGAGCNPPKYTSCTGAGQCVASSKSDGSSCVVASNTSSGNPKCTKCAYTSGIGECVYGLFDGTGCTIGANDSINGNLKCQAGCTSKSDCLACQNCTNGKCVSTCASGQTCCANNTCLSTCPVPCTGTQVQCGSQCCNQSQTCDTNSETCITNTCPTGQCKTCGSELLQYNPKSNLRY